MPNVGDLSAEELQHLFKQGYETNVTETAHRELYPALSPSNPELNQAGKVVLITGGGTGVGYAISRAFVQASADTVIILGRRSKVLATAASKLEQEAKAAGTDTKIVTRTCDVTNLTEVKAFWKDLAAKGVEVDVFVANAVKFSEPKPILELGAAEIWTQFEANVKSPLHMVENFHSQPGEKQKVSIPNNVPPSQRAQVSVNTASSQFLVNVSTHSIHMLGHPFARLRPGYNMTKMAGTL